MMRRKALEPHLLFAFLCLLVPSIIHAQTEALDLTGAFRAGGIEIDRLMVFKISGIVLIRGRTSNVAMAARAESLATSLGYRRVANLIEIIPGLADSEIERHGARELDMERQLEGCSFQIRSVAGVVRLRGRVRREVQGDLAVSLLSRIDGVNAVHSELISMKSDK
jgi:osmotically-inducible protein OsmY